MKPWLRYIRNFFGFSRSEALGFSLMALVLVLAYATWLVMHFLPAEPYQPWSDQRQLDSLVAVLEAADSQNSPQLARYGDSENTAPLSLFSFNPNSLPYDSLLLLSIPAPLARRMVNYREKGGSFRRPGDVLKIYGFPEELYEKLEPWIYIPEVKRGSGSAAQNDPYRRDKDTYPEQESKKDNLPPFATSEKFDLNGADSLQLLSVRGIGPVLSSRILKYRQALGGFVHTGQVREVWGLTPEAADALLQRGFLQDAPTVRKLHVNQAAAAELARHPYISWQQAGWIVAYREQHGPFQRPEDLRNIHQLDENFLNKLAPYLQF